MGSAISKAMVMMQVATSTGHTEMQKVIRETGHTIRELEMMASHDSEGFGAMAQSLGMTKKELNGLIKSGSDLENFAKISGMTSEQFVQAFEKDAIGAIGAFINGLGNAEEAGESAINMLEEMGISEIRLRDALLRAGNASELFADSVDIASNAWEENNALTNEAEERYKTFESKLAMFKNVLIDLGVTIGDVLLPALIKMMEFTSKIVEWISKLNPKIIEAVVVFTAISTAVMLVVGPMLLLIGFIPQIIGGFRALKTVVEFTGKGFRKFGGFISRVAKPAALLRGSLRLLGRVIGALTGPIGWVVLAIVELTLIFRKLYKTNEEFRKRIDKMWNAVTTKTRAAMAEFKRVVGPVFEQTKKAVLRIISVLSDNVTKRFGEMSRIAGDLWDKFGARIVSNLDRLLAVWNRVWPTMEKVFKIAWSGFQTALEIGSKLILGLLESIALLLSGDFAGAWKQALTSAETAINEIGNVLEKLGAVVSTVAGLLFDKAKKAISKKILEWASIIRSKLTDIRSIIIEKTSEWAYVIFEWLAEIPSEIKRKLSTWTVAFAEWMIEQKNEFIKGFSEWSKALVKWIKSAPKKVISSLSTWTDAITQWTEEQNEENKRQFAVWGIAISKWFTSIPSKITKLLGSWANAIVQWFASIPGIIHEKLFGWSVAFSTWFVETKTLISNKLAEWREAIFTWMVSIPVLIKDKLLEWTVAIGTWFIEMKDAIIEWMAGWLSSIATWFTDTKANIITMLAGWAVAISSWFVEMPTSIGKWLATWWTKFSTWMSEIPGRITKKLEEWWTAFKDWFKSVPDKPEVKNAGRNMIDKIAEGTKEKEPEFMEKLGKLILAVIAGVLALVAVAFIAAGRELIKMIVQGIQEQKENLIRRATAVIDAAKRAISKIDLVQVGKNLIAGLIRGITSKINDVVTAAGRVASAVKNKITGYFQVKSPSRLMMGIGVNLIEGLENGMLDMRSAITRTAAELAEAATVKPDLSYATPNANYGSLSAALSGEVNVNQRDSMLVGAIQSLEDKLTNLTVEMDKREVGRIVAPTVSEEINGQSDGATRGRGQRRLR